MVRYFQLAAAPEDAPVQVGFLVQSPTGQGCHVSFDDLRFTQQPLTGLRDGR